MIIRFSSIALTAFAFSLRLAAATPDSIAADTPLSSLLISAQSHLSRGSPLEALPYFDAALHKDPQNYLTLFKRGATYLSLGRNAQASRDFDQVLVLKPGFEGALLQRAKIRGRNAEWSSAREDYISAGRGKGSAEIAELEEAEGAARLSAQAEKEGDWEACVSQSGVAILVAGTALELRQRRARCRFERGEVIEALADLNHALQIDVGDVQPHLQISAMTFYSLGETEKGLTAISKCLHNDPENKACTSLRKAEKTLDRQLKKFNTLFSKRQFASAAKLLVGGAEASTATTEDQGLLQQVKTDSETYREAGYIHPLAGATLYATLVAKACEAYTEMNNARKSAQFCSEALTYDPESLPGLLHKAQTQLDAEEFDAAIGTLNSAKEVHGNTQPIATKLQNAQILLKRSKTKDYYKILGLDRSASESEIKRAMRKLTKIHHPDKASAHGISPEEAQKKMAAINEAYEVLSDPELKARFDRGEDPNDPMAQQQGQPFQGSPFGFGAGGQPVFFQQRGGGGPGASFKFQAGGGGFPFGQGFPF